MSPVLPPIEPKGNAGEGALPEEVCHGLPIEDPILELAARLREQHTSVTGGEVEGVGALPSALYADRIRATPPRVLECSRDYALQHAWAAEADETP